MKRRKVKNNLFEIIAVLLVFMLLAIGNAAAQDDVKDNVTQEIEVARAERTLALSDIHGILAGIGD